MQRAVTRDKACSSVIVEYDDLEQLMAEADRLDREMLLVMRQAIAAALVREAA